MRDLHFPGRSPVLASNGMVATSHPLAASEALSVLRDGGNAADAAIAGAVILGVCEPQMTGLGGDCFALVKPAGSEEVVALNGSGRAPAGLSPDALRAEGLEKILPGHPASITVPGAVDALCALSERYGKAGLERSLAPAIRLFDEGVPIAPRVAFDIADHGPAMNDDARRHYLNNGQPYRIGDRLRLSGQAEVLRRVAKNGRDAFYTGEVAEDMLSALAAIGGTHNADDFAGTKSSWHTPIAGPYRGHDLIEHPPNGQGATAILIAGILSQFDVAAMDPFGPERLHLHSEATKLAYDARNRFLADADHVTRLEHMLAPETARRLAALIDPSRAMAAPAPLTEDVHKDTILITVVDRQGMAVSLIYSIFATFGAGIASPKFGILFHNRGSGFNLTAGHANEAGPRKRPMHTIIPAMRATDGQIDMSFGVMGGQYQAAGHAYVLSNLADFGMDLQEALDAPRVFADPISGLLKVERGVPESTRQALADMGHSVEVPKEPIGGAQAILIDRARGFLVGASDPRKDGLAIGL
ncbi:gamma-glutamyltransferase family protein [Silicimonas sp. MF1-12-2]|uniref:gamma-glutamyltransferase family protein n=1 Tax=Silicimonas sp. MF1-12-2 TaxID=3384793 RepID=UPI0039B66ABD